jgi:hypothetical protein
LAIGEALLQMGADISTALIMGSESDTMQHDPAASAGNA